MIHLDYPSIEVDHSLYQEVTASDRKGKKMKYTIKKDAFSNQWYVITKNPALTYKTATWFETREDAEAYVQDEKAHAVERMANVKSVMDYLKVGN